MLIRIFISVTLLECYVVIIKDTPNTHGVFRILLEGGIPFGYFHKDKIVRPSFSVYAGFSSYANYAI